MRYFILLLLYIILFCATPAPASESFLTPATANESADSIGSTIERRNALGYDPTRVSLLPDIFYRYRAWQEKMNKKIGLEILFSYDTLGQLYADRDWSVGASSGDTTLSGRWLMFGQKYNRPVHLSFRMRYRKAYADLAPAELSSVTGLIWKTVDGFTDAGFQVRDFYVSQDLADGRLILRYGQLSIDNFFDTNQLESAKRYALNDIFSANPAIGFPSYGAGFTVQWKDTRNWDLAIGASNIQGNDTDKEISFSLSSSALYYNAQGGYDFKGFGKRDARVQLLGWQSKGNEEDELPDGTGVSLTLEQEGVSSGERFVARYAFSDGDATLVDQLFMLGWGREIKKYDHFGLAIGAGRSAEKNSRWQGVTEVYYRWQATKELMVTPDLQIIVGEGLEDGNLVQIVAGLRASITF
jgi:hypothetical protein